MTSRDLLTPVFYHWRPALLAFLIPVILALVVAALAVPIYTAQSRLLILPADDYVFQGSTGNSAGAANLTFDRAQIVNAEMEILNSKDLEEQALRTVGLNRVYPNIPEGRAGMDQALEKLSRDLKIENVPASNVINLQLRHRDPIVAADLLNTLVDLYVKRRQEIFDRSDVKAIMEQQADLKARLAGVEDDISDLSATYRLGDYNQELIAVQTRQTTLLGQVEGVDQQISEAGGREQRLGRDLSDTAPVITLNTDSARSQQIQALTTALTSLQEQRRVAAAKYRDGHPLVAELDRQIAGLQGVIAATPPQETALVRRGANPVYQDIDQQLATTRGQAAGLKAGRGAAMEALATNGARLAELIEIGPRYRELLRNRALLEGSYQDVAQKLEDARLKEALAGARANVRIVERAQPPSKGHTGRLVILIAGGMVGLLAGVAVIVISAATSQVMVSPGQAEDRLDLPVLATVPFGPDDPPRLPQWRPTPGRLALDDVNVLHRLMRSIAGERGGVMQFIAASEGEGVTTMAVDMALQRAERSTGKVLLVDVEPDGGDSLVARLQARRARLEPIEEAQGIYRVNRTRLHVTAPMSTPGAYLSDERWASFLTAARRDFGLTVLDSPAVQRSASGILVSALVDLTLLVVEAEETRAPVAESVIRRIEGAGGAVFGVVLNKRRFYIPQFIYAKL